MMKSLLITCALLMCCSCSIARDEMSHSGGVAGAALDRRFADANGSKKAQLLRATVIVALATRVAVGTLQDGDDADALIGRIRDVNEQINYLAGDLYGVPGKSNCKDLSVEVCDTRIVFFESNLPQLEYKIARMMLAALPQRQAAAFAEKAASGDVLGAAWKLLKLGARGADGGHRGAAAFRSTTEVLAMAKACDVSTLSEARACLKLTDQTALLKLIGEGSLTSIPADQPTLRVFFEMIRASCYLLPIKGEPGVDHSTDRMRQCASIKLQPDVRPGGLAPA